MKSSSYVSPVSKYPMVNMEEEKRNFSVCCQSIVFVLLCVSRESKYIDHPGYWHSAVLQPASTLMVKPLLRFLGLGGVVLAGEGSCLPPGSTEQLFLGTLGRTTGAFRSTEVCLCPSAIRGGRVGMGPESTEGLDLWVGWRGGLEGLGAPSSTCSDPSLMAMGSIWESSVLSFCMLLWREVLSALGISQLSVRRRELSCIRLVATTAFIAAWGRNNSWLQCAGSVEYSQFCSYKAQKSQHNMLHWTSFDAKMKILSSFTHSQVVPNLYELLSSNELIRRHLKNAFNQTVYGSHWLP